MFKFLNSMNWTLYDVNIIFLVKMLVENALKKSLAVNQCDKLMLKAIFNEHINRKERFDDLVFHSCNK